MASAPVEVQPDELLLVFKMQQQAVFDAVPSVLPWSRGKSHAHIAAGSLVLQVRSAHFTLTSP